MLTFTPLQRKGQSFVYALATLAFWWVVARRAGPRTPLAWAAVAVMLFVCVAFLALPRYRAPYHAFFFLVAFAPLVRQR